MSRASAVAEPAEARLDVSPWQGRALELPLGLNVACAGGRGGGKSYFVALRTLRHATTFGAASKTLAVRRDHQGAKDFAETLNAVFLSALGNRGFSASLAAPASFRLDGGATCEVNQVEGLADLGKYQGRSFSRLVFEEASQWSSPRVLDRLRGNLRAPRGVPCSIDLSANPGNSGHDWVAKRFARRHPWTNYAEDWTGLDPATAPTWITIPTTATDNPFIDQTAYRNSLSAACADDPELLRAWTLGDWSAAVGSFFGDVLSDASRLDSRVYTPEWFERGWAEPSRTSWEPPCSLRCSLDWGTSAPTVVYVTARARRGFVGPCGRWIPAGSTLLLDEIATLGDLEDLSKGDGSTVPEVARMIHEKCAEWRMQPQGWADDSIFAKAGHEAGSIGDEFRKHGVSWWPASKASRIAGWQTMRSRMKAALTSDVNAPHLLISDLCMYFWATAPTAPRSPVRREDVDTKSNDHGLDAARYALTGAEYGASIVRLWM